jgi:hypothetical protein
MVVITLLPEWLPSLVEGDPLLAHPRPHDL